jgi:pyruvate ferredoxin oxidoreductase gamma subunit
VIRIRFHGRGGHGTKTASRIVGSAAYLGGSYAQDSPVYGAERRGAPIAAFTRIDQQPILERGLIESPDIIVVADETLLADPLAGVLVGQESASVVFVNTDADERVRKFATITPRLITYDISKRTHDELGQVTALSAGLAGAAARLCGVISNDQLAAATREELLGLGFSGEIVEKNVAIARDVFSALPRVEIEPRVVTRPDEMMVMPYENPVLGSPEILHTGNAVLKKTGNWRVEEPVFNLDKCSRCGLCLVLCPDGAISLNPQAYPVVDYDHCKGCMICAQICPPKAIDTRKEVKAW